MIQQAQSGTGKTATFCAGILNNLDYNLLECQVRDCRDLSGSWGGGGCGSLGSSSSSGWRGAAGAQQRSERAAAAVGRAGAGRRERGCMDAARRRGSSSSRRCAGGGTQQQRRQQRLRRDMLQQQRQQQCLAAAAAKAARAAAHGWHACCSGCAVPCSSARRDCLAPPVFPTRVNFAVHRPWCWRPLVSWPSRSRRSCAPWATTCR